MSINVTNNNIHFMRTAAPLLAPIFRSDTQARLLSTLLLDDSEKSIVAIADLLHTPYPALHREIGRLQQAGILTERRAGRTRLIRADPESPLTSPLREILRITTGPVPLLRRALGEIEGIESAFLYGSFAARLLGETGPAPEDVDVMVVGHPDADAVYDACSQVEDEVRRPVNPTILGREELEAGSGFLTQVRSSPLVEIIGEIPWT